MKGEIVYHWLGIGEVWELNIFNFWSGVREKVNRISFTKSSCEERLPFFLSWFHFSEGTGKRGRGEGRGGRRKGGGLLCFPSNEKI